MWKSEGNKEMETYIDKMILTISQEKDLGIKKEMYQTKTSEIACIFLWQISNKMFASLYLFGLLYKIFSHLFCLFFQFAYSISSFGFVFSSLLSFVWH